MDELSKHFPNGTPLGKALWWIDNKSGQSGTYGLADTLEQAITDGHKAMFAAGWQKDRSVMELFINYKALDNSYLQIYKVQTSRWKNRYLNKQKRKYWWGFWKSVK